MLMNLVMLAEQCIIVNFNFDSKFKKKSIFIELFFL